MADKETDIVIKTIDKTEGGFASISTNFKIFDKQVENLEKNLRPLSELINAGLVSGGAIAAIGAYGKNSGQVAGALSDLRASFLGVQSTARDAGESLGFLNSTMEILTTCGTKVTQFMAIVKGGFEAGKQIRVGYKAINMLLTEHTAIQEAAKLATVAKTAADVTSAGVATTKTATTIADTASTSSNTVAKNANTVSLGIWNGMVWAATAAQSAFNIALSLNPIGAVVAAIASAVAAIGLLISGISYVCTWMNNTHDATGKAVETTQKLREEHEKSRAECEQYASRLQLLQEKETLSSDEQKETAQIVQKLNERYEGLGLTLDTATGKVVDASGAFVNLKKVMAEGTGKDLENEIGSLEKHLKALKSDLDTAEGSWWVGGEDELQGQIAETKKALDEAKKKKLDNDNAITQLELEEQKKVQEQKKKDAEELQKVLDDNGKLQKDLQKEISDEGKTAQEKELDAIREKIAARETELNRLRESGKITNEQYTEEKKNLAELGKQRIDQIKERYKKEKEEKEKKEEETNKKEVDAAGAAISRKKEKRNAEAREKAEDQTFDELLKTNPAEALRQMTVGVSNSMAGVGTAETKYNDYLQKAQEDGKLSDAEKKELARLEKEYDEAVRQNERNQQKYDRAESELAANVTGLMENMNRSTGPVESYSRGSVEAFKKEMELERKTESPEAARLAEIQKALEERYAKQQKTADETKDLTKQLVENVKGV